VIAKVLECYAAEGGIVTPEDLAALNRFAGELAKSFDKGPGEIPCNANPGAGVACAKQVATLDCQSMADKLSGEVESLLSSGPPQPWALAYADSIRGKVVQCYTEEVGAEPSAEEATRLDEYRDLLARTLTTLTTGAGCKVRPEKQAECIAGLSAIPCGTIAESLTSDADQLIQALIAHCEGFLDCVPDLWDLDPVFRKGK
jgi:hypothetical protein